MNTENNTLTHEKIVNALKLVQENDQKLNAEKNALKTQIKELNLGFRKVQKSVTGNLPKVSLMVNSGIAQGITTNGKLTQDSGVSKTTISRFDWIGATLSRVGITKTSEKLAVKTLNELSKNNLGKTQLETIKDIEDWKNLLAVSKEPKSKKLDLETVKNAILEGQFSTSELQELGATVSLQLKNQAQ
jgi:hypothetical protein